ncbi:uncharacterized protein, partial [Argopecten irradians]|uniref:uncharacterized protein n=1 Tax=Argopecten irradians TaxID=31199 RepID=UPI00371083C0
ITVSDVSKYIVVQISPLVMCISILLYRYHHITVTYVYKYIVVQISPLLMCLSILLYRYRHY